MSTEKFKESLDEAMGYAGMSGTDLDEVEAALRDALERVERARVLRGENE